MTIDATLVAGRDDAPALRAPGCTPLSHAMLRDAIDRHSAALAQCGIGREDSVAIVLPNGAAMAVAFLSVAASAIAAPLNPGYTRAEFDFYFDDLKPRALIVAQGGAAMAREAAQARGIPVIELVEQPGTAGMIALDGSAGPAVAPGTPAPDDVALLLHTSGTTARPKIVPLTHRQLDASARNIVASLALSDMDCGLHVMPLFHVHGLVAGLLAPLAAGGSIYCTPGFDRSRFPDWLADAGPSWLTAVPTMLQSILAWAREAPDAARAARLRFIRSCSAALPPAIAEGLEAAFATPVIEAYAMTEAAHQMTSNPLPDRARKFGSVGMAAGPQVAILDAQGAILPPGQVGEVAIRGENVMHGYRDNPEANRSAFTNGWFRTGDLGQLDADGYVWLTGRAKEIINRGGDKVSPVEVENRLLEHPAVAQAVAFAVPHATLGEEVGAAVVLRDKVTVEALRKFLLLTLSAAKVPRAIRFLDELPKGPTGKLRRIGLAAELGLDGTVALIPYRAPQTPMEQRLADLWQGILAVERVGRDDDFFDLGGNSIAATQIVATLRGEQGVTIPIVDFLDHPTLAAFAAHVTQARLLALSPEELDRLLAGMETPQTPT